MIPPRQALVHFGPALSDLRWHPVGGGFSGADVWRGDDASGAPVVAFKMWPAGFPPQRLEQIHQWIAEAAPLPFVPRIVQDVTDHSSINESGRLCDAVRWMPGKPSVGPTPAEVSAACTALAKLHQRWSIHATTGIVPAIQNRITVLRDWMRSPVTPLRLPHFSPALNSLLVHASELATQISPLMLNQLEKWEYARLRLHPCIRDLRGEHVLFTGGVITGIVDYGAAAIDHPASDLSRLLGEYASKDEDLFGIGLQAYREAGSELDIPDHFVQELSKSGSVCSVIMWLIRLQVERRSYPDALSVEDRIRSLIQRIK